MKDVVKQSLKWAKKVVAKHRVQAVARGIVNSLFVEIFFDRAGLFKWQVTARLPNNKVRLPPGLGDFYFDRSVSFRNYAKAEAYFEVLVERYGLEVYERLDGKE